MQLQDIYHSYFAAFERYVEDADPATIADFFADDVSYQTAEGSCLEGKAPVLDYLQRSLDGLDRRFDSREFVGKPRVSAAGPRVTMHFTVRYRKRGVPDLTLCGTEVATFAGGKIQLMVDQFNSDSIGAFERWMELHGVALA